MDLLMIILVVSGFAALLIFLNSKTKELKEDRKGNKEQELLLSVINDLRRDVKESSGKDRKEVQERLDRIAESLNQGISRSSQALERQFKESRVLIKEASQKIAHFEETNKKIAGFASQLQSLENILQNPKQRGVLGEYYLETMLKNVFDPGQYQMQYKFSNGEVVDAVIFYQGKVLPIDSKFSMENYNKMVKEKDSQRKKILNKELVADIKKRINETAKYIRSKDNTFDFAFMFIPSEGIYYDMLVAEVGALRETSRDLIEFAYRKNVIPVSPTSFYAYLQTILHGLRNVEMKESMTLVIKRIEQLDKHLKNYETYFSKLGSNLSTTVNTYNKSSHEFAKIDKDVYRISDGRSGGKRRPKAIERPEMEEGNNP